MTFWAFPGAVCYDRSLIACQACCSLSTVLLECFLECLIVVSIINSKALNSNHGTKRNRVGMMTLPSRLNFRVGSIVTAWEMLCHDDLLSRMCRAAVPKHASRLMSHSKLHGLNLSKSIAEAVTDLGNVTLTTTSLRRNQSDP